MYKIQNNRTASDIRTSFSLNNEYDYTDDLRNREIDLSLPKPTIDSGKNALIKITDAVAWNNLTYEEKVAESVSSVE